MNPNCDKEWTRQFVAENFKKQWITGQWQKTRENLLYDREKALLPATQGLAENRKIKERTKIEIKELDAIMAGLIQRKRELLRQTTTPTTIATSRTSSLFVRACPSDECRGYLNDKWECGLCNVHICRDCHAAKNPYDAHVCNADDKATAALLNEDTRPCPKCSTGIFKITGCDQMWCTMCHTAFDWKTGRLENNVHNPHYFEYLRTHPANLGVPRNLVDHYVCGQEVDRTFIQSVLNQTRNLEAPQIQQISYILQSILHLREVQMRKYQTNNTEDNRELRIQYLCEFISEDQFKTSLQRSNKAYEKKQEIHQIMDLFHRTVSEIMLRMYQYIQYKAIQSIRSNTVQSFLDEIEALRAYVNQCLADISTTYGSKQFTALFYNDARGSRTSRGWTRDVFVTDRNPQDLPQIFSRTRNVFGTDQDQPNIEDLTL